MRKQFGDFLPLIGMVTVLGVNLLNVPLCAAAGKKQQVSTFAEIYEPSTVVQLADGRILIAEDEGDMPLYLSRVVNLKGNLILEPVQLQGTDVALDDLEGSALGKDGNVYLITSHSVNKKGKRKKKREVLVRLTIKDDKILEIKTYNGLLLPIKKALRSKSGIGAAELQQLNIEGLYFDSAKKKLLLGLRTPLAGNKAIILVLENPSALFSKGQAPKFQQKNIYLEMGGGGIRSITYDSRHKVYLLTNEIPNKKGKLRPAVWAWNGKPHSQPSRVVLPKLKGIKNIEGITLVKYQKKTFILMVADDGIRKKKKGAHYCFLDTATLIF